MAAGGATACGARRAPPPAIRAPRPAIGPQPALCAASHRFRRSSGVSSLASISRSNCCSSWRKTWASLARRESRRRCDSRRRVCARSRTSRISILASVFCSHRATPSALRLDCSDRCCSALRVSSARARDWARTCGFTTRLGCSANIAMEREELETVWTRSGSILQIWIPAAFAAFAAFAARIREPDHGRTRYPLQQRVAAARVGGAGQGARCSGPRRGGRRLAAHAARPHPRARNCANPCCSAPPWRGRVARSSAWGPTEGHADISCLISCRPFSQARSPKFPSLTDKTVLELGGGVGARRARSARLGRSVRWPPTSSLCRVLPPPAPRTGRQPHRAAEAKGAVEAGGHRVHA